MRAAEPFSGHFMPKEYFGNRTLRQCGTRGKGKNIVFIEVDSEDFGDVIILDVPESLQEKFRKNHDVISIDDDDDGIESRAGGCNTSNDATTSNRFSSVSPVRSSNCANNNGGGVFVGEGSEPVKLSKSKRTYSGKSVSRNRYGLGPGSESYSSESDDSDCEIVEDSFGELRQKWEKASFRRRHDTGGHSEAEAKAGPSASDVPLHSSAEEGTTEHLRPTSDHSNLTSRNNDSVSWEFAEENQFSHKGFHADGTDELSTGKHGPLSDLNDHAGTCGCDQPSDHDTDSGTTEHSESPHDNGSFKGSPINHGKDFTSNDFAERLSEQSKSPQQGSEAEDVDLICRKDSSDDVSKGSGDQDVELYHPELSDSEQSAERPDVVPDHSNGHCTDSKLSSGHNDIITDRQKIKETDEYKRAMEEELAARQQQLKREAEEARRLRNRKRAENTRLMDNVRRQKLRLEEVRETRRKDQENLNLKDKLRVEIRNELRKLEATCLDMASLLRSLGIHVDGGFYPSPNQVQAAYKRACLRFHPDRISTTDLRQQVEAEEKFKLISNMKDKLSF